MAHEAITHGQDPSGAPGAINVHTVDPAGNSWVTSQYHISDLDTASSPMYFGYVDPIGTWYIMQLNTTNGTARYCKGSGGYAAAWSGRASQSYDYFSNVW